MPFYDLRCTECQTEHRISATMSEKANKHIACPDCGSHEMETVFKNAPAYVKGRKEFACPHSGACGRACAGA